MDCAAVIRDVLDHGRRRELRGRSRRARSRSVARASSWRRWRRWPSWACGSSPTTAPACKTAALMRRALEYAKGYRRRRLGPALRGQLARGGRVDARRRVVLEARHPRPTVVGRDRDGAARHRTGAASPARRFTSCTCPRPSRSRAVAAAQGRGPAGHRRGRAASLHADRRVLLRLRRDVQGEPAAAHRGRRRSREAARSDDGTVDAIATDHAPHAPETKELPVRSGAAGHARPRDRARRLR